MTTNRNRTNPPYLTSERVKAAHFVFDRIDFDYTQWDDVKRMIDQKEAEFMGVLK